MVFLVYINGVIFWEVDILKFEISENVNFLYCCAYASQDGHI